MLIQCAIFIYITVGFFGMSSFPERQIELEEISLVSKGIQYEMIQIKQRNIKIINFKRLRKKYRI